MKKTFLIKTCLLSLLLIAGLTIRAQEPNELVIIDQSVGNYQEIVDQFTRSVDVFVIPLNGNPLELISLELDKHPDVKVVHIFVMCKPGAMVFDQLAIIDSNIDQYSWILSQWKQKLSANSEILIYGSELSTTDEGKKLVGTISEKTGAVVKSSTKKTGLDTDSDQWDLDYSTGVSKSKTIFPEQPLNIK